MIKYIILTTQFPAIHAWPLCNIPDVSYLKYPHRHMFHVVMKFEVTDNDRQIEFIRTKQVLDNHLTCYYRDQNLGGKSCEDIAEELIKEFKADYVSVMEDNENGAEIYGD